MGPSHLCGIFACGREAFANKVGCLSPRVPWKDFEAEEYTWCTAEYSNGWYRLLSASMSVSSAAPASELSLQAGEVGLVSGDLGGRGLLCTVGMSVAGLVGAGWVSCKKGNDEILYMIN